MKKAILITMTALLLISSFTACGSKKNTDEGEPAYSRVLYDDEDTSAEEETDVDTDAEGESESESDTETDTNKKDTDEKSSDKKDSDKSTSSNSKKKDTDTSASSKTAATSSKAPTNARTSSGSNTSSRTTTSTATTTSSNNSTSSRPSSSSPSSSSSNVSSAANTDTTTNTNTDSDTETDTNTDTTWFGTDTDTENTDTDTDTEIERGTLEASDMVFPVGGTQLEIGQEFSSVYEYLGSPTIEDVAGGRLYTYPGYAVTTAYGEGETESVTKIKVSSPSYPVSKNIGIGSTTDDLLRAFGDPDEEYTYKYTYDGKVLEFIILNGYVAEINFYSVN